MKTLHFLLVLAAASAPGLLAGGTLDVFVGTYTGGKSEGIYRFTLDTETGATTPPVLAAESKNPSFLALSPGGDRLYAVNETDDFDPGGSGAVSAFAISAGGELRPLGQRSSRGADPCHLAVDADGRRLVVANYSGGNVALLPIQPGGALAPSTFVRAHTGQGPKKGRQDGPHAHAVVFDPGGRFLLSADLGADRVFVYRVDREHGTLQPGVPKAASLPAGSGPRHLAFDPKGRFVYVINELASTLAVFSWDAEGGRMSPVQSVSTLPPGFSGDNSTAEVAVSPDGRFVYGSNRGHDSLAVFRVDDAAGTLTLVGHVPTGGKAPRHFAIDPTGRFILAANQGTGTIVVFRVDGESGMLSAVGEPVLVDRPVCVLPVPPRP